MRLLAPLMVWSFLFLVSASSVHAEIQFLIFEPVLSGLELSLSASISGLTSTSCSTENKCFLQGTLRSVGASKYFGQTQNNINSWIDYISSPELEYIQSTFFQFQPEAGSWSGQLKMRYSSSDDEYKGPGNYEVKFKRFSGKSVSSSGESNTLVLALTTAIPTPTPTPTPTSTPTSVPTATPTPTSTPTPTPTPTSTPTPTPTSTPTPSSSPTEAPQAEPDLASLDTPLPLDEFDVLGSSDSAPPSISENQVNLRDTSIFFGVAVATVGLLALAFWRLRKLTVSAKMKP